MPDLPINKLNDLRTFAQNIITILDGLNIKKELNIPFPFKGTYKITQKFGENPDIYKSMGYAGHFGLDFATPWGTAIFAVDDGKVCRAGYTPGNGNFIEVEHSWGKSLYMHFKEPSVFKVGDKITSNTIVGHAGNTGLVFPKPSKANPYAGTHLHFSIKINGITNPDYKDFIDPYEYIKVR